MKNLKLRIKACLAILVTCYLLPIRCNGQNWITLPDANFVSALQDVIPDALIGNQLNTESPIVAATYSLDVGGHGITNLYGLQFFTSLTSLECQNNGLSTLPELPETLKELYCYSNQLTSLPVLPKSLLVLDCSSNQLSSLPVLPSTLKNLSCFRNKLTSLPDLPKMLTDFLCGNNKIICFPILPNSITAIDIRNNPFTCLPNYIKEMENDTAKAPLCELGNKNGCIVESKKK